MLYTGKGDGGTTKLLNLKKGERVSKASCNIEALGVVDELNSFLGLTKAELATSPLKIMIADLSLNEITHSTQETLFIAQTEIAGNQEIVITEEKVAWLEKYTNTIEEMLPPITSFLIPGASRLSSYYDVCRTLARKAERSIVACVESDEITVGEPLLAYFNRLSSLLYACTRIVNHTEHAEETPPSYQ